jgi:HK97 gp10 family phage protein
MADQFEVLGLKELDKILKDLPENLRKSALKKALVQGGTIIQQTAVALAPRRRGNLANAIELKYLSDAGNGNGGVAVFVNKKKAWYGRLEEFGTAPHVIRVKRGKALKIGSTYVKEVQHPGAAARPFMRPAFDTKKREAVEVIRLTLANTIESYIRRAYRQHQRGLGIVSARSIPGFGD